MCLHAILRIWVQIIRTAKKECTKIVDVVYSIHCAIYMRQPALWDDYRMRKIIMLSHISHLCTSCTHKHSCIHSYPTCRSFIVCSLSNKQFLCARSLAVAVQIYIYYYVQFCSWFFFPSGFQLPFSLYTSSLHHFNTKENPPEVFFVAAKIKMPKWLENIESLCCWMESGKTRLWNDDQKKKRRKTRN